MTSTTKLNPRKTIEKLTADLTKVPSHIAIIMDGNRRWAKKNNLPAAAGHIKGALALTNVVKLASKLKIKTLTVFAFSTENWLRSKIEINSLMKLFNLYLKKQLKFMQKEKVKLSVIGDLSKLPENLQKAFNSTIEKTKDNDVIELVIAVNYGFKDEMKRAIQKIVEDFENKKISKSDISEDLISEYLDTKNHTDPDLFIRTSGENRLSNFLLWQQAYSEIYITDILWPDFKEKDFLNAIHEFQKRKRRFGA
ncbi:MAG: Ditrans,polycis-undecaprenyl-diphosphate synthase ((2E,6E)-farnesyl-diphosphate specific) [Candidatus Anoxychlamydiales bacterium]|nr:Ditrans,polycis-undecaprenyl-diphosphate synthase ((2E,6E)-farnesyl-diphosphate specific) [Candidatus Anoxychlamydiales bacterium]NGX52479.1 Ditrans,polycis-undecaprenyl-diphosphate synthase ((2E,6E)-farnesyl-diphosphate specific) [Candidatus Anoxychlamydiales bacterium]